MAVQIITGQLSCLHANKEANLLVPRNSISLKNRHILISLTHEVVKDVIAVDGWAIKTVKINSSLLVCVYLLSKVGCV